MDTNTHANIHISKLQCKLRNVLIEKYWMPQAIESLCFLKMLGMYVDHHSDECYYSFHFFFFLFLQILIPLDMHAMLIHVIRKKTKQNKICARISHLDSIEAFILPTLVNHIKNHTKIK